jgi:hypothetical protein
MVIGPLERGQKRKEDDKELEKVEFADYICFKTTLEIKNIRGGIDLSSSFEDVSQGSTDLFPNFTDAFPDSTDLSSSFTDVFLLKNRQARKFLFLYAGIFERC